MWKKLLSFVVLATSAVVATCHGFMAEPAARNVLSKTQHYNAGGLSNQGASYTYAGKRKWTSKGSLMWDPKKNAQHGVCGGLQGDTNGLDFQAGGKYATKKITGTYAAGQTIRIRVEISAPHGGRWQFGVCPVPDGASDADERRVVTQQCMDSNKLINMDKKNAGYGTQFWWFGKRTDGVYELDMKLPDKIECKRCVLQWHWETANSCNIPGTPSSEMLSTTKDSCEGAQNMEEFWNCADIAILPKGTPVPPPPKPQPASKEQVKENKALRAARKQQANELRRQAESMPKGPIRDLVMGQVKMLEDVAKGGAGEGFTNYVPRYRNFPLYRDAVNAVRTGIYMSEAVLAGLAGIAAVVAPSVWTIGFASMVVGWIVAAQRRIRESWQDGGYVAAWPWQVAGVDEDLRIRLLALKMPSVPEEPARRRAMMYGS
jgi:hypothetical protein